MPVRFVFSWAAFVFLVVFNYIDGISASVLRTGAFLYSRLHRLQVQITQILGGNGSPVSSGEEHTVCFPPFSLNILIKNIDYTDYKSRLHRFWAGTEVLFLRGKNILSVPRPTKIKRRSRVIELVSSRVETEHQLMNLPAGQAGTRTKEHMNALKNMWAGTEVLFLRGKNILSVSRPFSFKIPLRNILSATKWVGTEVLFPALQSGSRILGALRRGIGTSGEEKLSVVHPFVFIAGGYGSPFFGGRNILSTHSRTNTKKPRI